MSPKRGDRIQSTLTDKHVQTHVVPMLRYFEALPKPTQRKSASDVAEIRQVSSEAVAAGDSDCQCWFKDSNGGDFCVPYSNPQDCKSAGGTAVPGDCPNFFAALKASRGLTKILAKKPATPKKGGVKASSRKRI